MPQSAPPTAPSPDIIESSSAATIDGDGKYVVPAPQLQKCGSDSRVLEWVQISNADGTLRVNLLSHGASLVSVYFADKDGNPVDLILGYDTIEEYQRDRCFFGRTVGRVSNRIREGKITVDGKERQLEINRPPHHLHGGTNSIAHRNWEIHRRCSASVTFLIAVKEEEDGYPGDALFKTTYTVNDLDQLIIEHYAETTQPCPINMTNHAFWNLDGQGCIVDHRLKVAASKYLEVNDMALPTGEVLSVDGTVFDYRNLRAVGTRTGKEGPVVKIDNDFILEERERGAHALILESDVTGIRLEVSTSYPAIHIFSAHHLTGDVKGKAGRGYECHAGLAIEAQKWSAAPSYPHFPSIVLRPGETYEEEVVYTLSHIS